MALFDQTGDADVNPIKLGEARKNPLYKDPFFDNGRSFEERQTDRDE